MIDDVHDATVDLDATPLGPPARELFAWHAQPA